MQKRRGGWLTTLEENFKYMTKFKTNILVIKDKND